VLLYDSIVNTVRNMNSCYYLLGFPWKFAPYKNIFSMSNFKKKKKASHAWGGECLITLDFNWNQIDL